MKKKDTDGHFYRHAYWYIVLFTAFVVGGTLAVISVSDYEKSKIPADACYTQFVPEIKTQKDLENGFAPTIRFTTQQRCLIINCFVQSGKGITIQEMHTLSSCKTAGFIK